MYVTELEKGKSVQLTVQDNRQAYVLCIEGKVTVNGQETLEERDAMEVKGTTLDFVTSQESGSHLLVVEMPLD